jgi:hypothetical protein
LEPTKKIVSVSAVKSKKDTGTKPLEEKVKLKNKESPWLFQNAYPEFGSPTIRTIQNPDSGAH